jgi:hypothetical protein
MPCKVHAACYREFRLNTKQRDQAINRAFQLDRNSPRADIPGHYPYRWEVRKMDLLVHYFSPLEQHWYVLRQDEDFNGPVPGFSVHIVVFKVIGDTLVFSQDLRKHEQAEVMFRTELLGVRGTYTVPLDDLAQERELVRQLMDEYELPKSWKPSGTVPPPPPPKNSLATGKL